MYGVLGVSGVDCLCCPLVQATNKEQSIRIQSSGGLSEDQVEQMVREGEQYAEADKARKAGIEAKNEAETAIYSSEKSLNEYKDKVPQVSVSSATSRTLY